ncbi:hypothetical protein K7W42_19390 [Deinococcus sp. HMF7604]|uniref:hypothetical protein n=1 Tax=Deinococcus betulae TaxID=2873312 RepID=UPI001CCF9B16|nr:hypothetical protein [Deinococcus betulae]MBZ9753006.1 hypothetical protein [Deinococcus betulae]
MPTKAKYRFGKNSVVRVAPIPSGSIAADGTVTKPVTGNFKVLCLHNSVSVGLENGTIDLENFCTGGKTVSVRDGTQQGSLEIANVTWVEDDLAVKILEDAAFSGSETGGWVYFEVQPLGSGTGKPIYDLIVDVLSWRLTTPAKGTITVEHQNLSVLEGPTRGVQA